MGRYDFVDEYVGPGITQQIGSGVSEVLGGLRRKKDRDREEARYQTDLGFRNRAEGRDVLKFRQDSVESGFGDPEEMGEPAGLSEASEGEGGELTGMGSYPGQTPGSSATPRTSATSQAIGGLRYDYSKSRDAQGAKFRNTLDDEDVKEANTRTDRLRSDRITNLTPRVGNAADAGAIVDNDLNFRDVKPEYSDPGFYENKERLRDIDVKGDVSRQIGVYRGRRDLDRDDPIVKLGELRGLLDSHRSEVKLAEDDLAEISKAKVFPDDPDPPEALAARQRLSDARKRFGRVNQMVMNETRTRLGVTEEEDEPEPESGVSGPGTPTPSELARSKEDPEFAAFLRDKYKIPDHRR